MRFCNKKKDHFGRVNLELQLVTWTEAKGALCCSETSRESTTRKFRRFNGKSMEILGLTVLMILNDFDILRDLGNL